MTMTVSAITSVSVPYAPAASVSAVSVSTALATIATTRSGTLVISDTADNISRNLNALQAGRARISAMSISDDNPLTISAKQLQANAGALAKISSYSLAITNALAANVKSLATNTKIGSIAVRDTAANLSANINSLQTNAAKLSEIRQQGTAAPITITAAQFASATDAIGKIKDSYSLNVRGVRIAGLSDVAANDHVKGIGVVDTSSNIASNLDLLQGYGVKLLSATSTDNAPLSVTVDQIEADALTLGKIYSGYQLNVRGATLADLASLSKNSKIKSIEVEDTAENVARNLDALKRLGSSLSAINITDPENDLSMSAKQYTSFTAVLNKIATADVHFSLYNASVANAADLSADDTVTSIKVTDTSANLSTGLASLDSIGSKLTEVTRSGSPVPLTLTAAQLTNYGSTIAKISNTYSLAVTGVAAADADTVAAMEDVSSMVIADSSSDIGDAWDTLVSTPVLAKLKEVRQTGTSAPLSLSAAQINSGDALLEKISGTVQLAATDVTAAGAIALAKDSRVKSMDVVDSSANLSQYFDALHGLGSKISSIKVSDDSNPLSVTASQLRTKSATLDKISGDYALAVRLVFASDAEAIAATDHVSSVAVADTAANVSANLSALTALDDKLEKIRLLGKNPITVDAQDLDTSESTFAKITNGYSLSVKDAAASDAKAIASRDHVVAVSVSDIGENIVSTLADLNGIGDELTSITQSDDADMDIDSAVLLASGKVLAKLSNDYQLNVNKVTVGEASLIAKMRNVSQMNLVDSGTAITANFNKLIALNPLIGTIEQSGTPATLNLSRTQRLAGAALLPKIDSGDYTLSISGARAADVATLAADTHVTSIHVVDTAFSLVQNLSALKAAMSVESGSDTLDKLTDIAMTGSANLVMTASQLADYDTVLDKFTTNHLLDIRGASAEDASSIAERADVVSLSVTDSNEGIATNLDALQSICAKLKSVTISGDSTSVSLSATQLIADSSVLNKISNRYTLSVGNVSAENATRVAAYKNVAVMDIVDSSDNIARRIDRLQKVVTKISSITQSGTSAALKITAAQRVADAEVLAKLDTYTLALRRVSAADAETIANDDLVDSFSVTDSASNIGQYFDALTAGSDKLSSIIQSGIAAPISLNLQQYTDGASTLAKILNSHNIALTDVQVADAAAAGAHTDVVTVGISDTSAAVTGDIDALNALGVKLKSIELSDSDVLELSASKYKASQHTLGRIVGSYSVSVSAASAEDAVDIAADPSVKQVDIADTSANVAANFDDLAGLGTELGSITLDSLDENVAITMDQYEANAPLLDKISGDYRLELSDVSADKASTIAADTHVATISVTDDSTGLITNLSALQALDTQLGSITLTDNLTPLALSSTQWTDSADTLAKISNGYRATVSDVATDDVASLGDNEHVSALSVSDTGEAVAGKFSELAALGNKLTAINLSGGSTVPLSAKQLKEFSTVIGKIETAYSLQVSEVPAASVGAIGARGDVGSFEVSDDAANLSKYWPTLRQFTSNLSGVLQSDSDAITITATQFAQSSALLSKLDDSYQLAVQYVSAEAAAGVAEDTHVQSLSVWDEAGNLSDHIQALIDTADKLTAITVSDTGTLSLSATQLQENPDFIAKIATDYTLSVSGASAADATTIAADSHVKDIAVEDSSDNIATELDNLQALGTTLVSITQSGTPSTMTVTASQVVNDADTLDKITESYALDVTDSEAAYAMQLADLPTVASIAVKDSAIHIAAQLEDLQTLGDKLTAISLSDSTPLLEISGEQYAANTTVLQKLSDASVSVVAAKVSQLSTLDSDSNVSSISVQDTAAHIGSNFTKLTDLGDKLASIGITGNGSLISLSATQYAGGSDTLAKIADSYTLALSGMSASDAATLSADTTVTQLSVSDTASNIVGQLSGLDDLGTRLLSLTQSDSGDMAVTNDEFDLGQALWQKFNGTLSLSVTGALASNVGTIAGQSYVSHLSISDSSAHVATHWDALSAAANKLQTVELSDAGTAMSISASQLQTGSALVAKLPDGFALSVSAVGVDDASSIATKDYVSSLSVADTADNIVSSLASLSALDKLASFTVTDGSTLELTAAQQDSYATLLAKLDSSITVTLPA
jgi:hypothetical protein